MQIEENWELKLAKGERYYEKKGILSGGTNPRFQEYTQGEIKGDWYIEYYKGGE